MTIELRSYGIAALLFSAASACWAASPFASTDPLLAIDLNRSAIVADIVKSFEAQFGSEASAQLKARLENLRADHLLAASLASSRASLDAILAEVDSPAPAAFAPVREKALGDANRDLVYTPIVPCLIVNTFTSPIGRLPAASTTAFDASAADFTPQGGLNACATALPTNMAAIAVQVAAVSPSDEGWLNIWQVGAPRPNTVTVGYYRDQTGNLPKIATGGAIVPLCTSACAGGKEFNIFAKSEVVATVTVVGYFAAPQGTVVTSITAGTGLTGGTITSTGTIGIADAGVGTTQLTDAAVTTAKVADGAVTTAKMAGNGCTSGQVLQFNGAAWVCASPAATSGGTVTSVATGTGLTGGPITAAGTISIAAGGVGTAQLADGAVSATKMASNGCTSGQVLQFNGAAWVCASPAATSGGTVTSVATGTGLTGGPITAAGTISIAALGVGTAQLADAAVTTAKLASASVTTAILADGAVSAVKMAGNGCASGQVLKFNGAAWACAADANSGGTLTSLTAGTGLTGGTITGAGTIGLAATNLLPTTPCATNETTKWSGTAWVCAAASTGGTVTSVATGTGLTGGPITGSGTISIATLGVGTAQLADAGVTTAKLAGASVTTAQLADGAVSAIKMASNGCASGQILKYNGTAWACAADASSGGTVTSITAGTGLTGGTITGTGTIGLAATNLLPTVACATNQIPKWNGTAWACAADATSGGTVTGVTASAPLASSGGTAPNISLTGAIPVANGGTGQATLAANGVLIGQGAAGVAAAVGAAGQVLAGTAGAPAWTGSPSLSGNLTLVASAAGAGNIYKGASPFIHNFGSANTFIGENAGNLLMSGSNNTGSGAGALANNTSGTSNTANGVSALAANTIGTGNAAAGASALFSNTSGGNNTASGAFALASNTTGGNNTATGTNALSSNVIGGSNTAAGAGALFGNSSGNNNTAVGFNALINVSTGNGNIGVGNGAGANINSGSFNIMIGNDGTAIDSGAIRIGTPGLHSQAFIAGIRGVATGVANAIPVLIDGNGQLGTISSSRRFKDDIADMDAASSALMNLRPVTFHYKADRNPSGRTLQYGLIAEEVAEVYPGLVAHSADGQIETVMYQFLPSMLLNEYQKQQRTIQAQARHIARLEQERQLQMARMDALEKQSARMAATVEQLQRTGTVTAGLLK